MSIATVEEIPVKNLLDRTRPLVGLPLKRKEDPRLLTGRAKYLDDLRFEGMLNGFVVRSPHARAKISHLDISACLDSPGVRLVLTAGTLPKNLGTLPVLPADDGRIVPRPILALDEAKYVGEAVAFVIADSRYQAEDAAEMVAVDYEVLEPAISPVMTLEKHHSNKVHTESIENGSVIQAFKNAQRTLSLEYYNQRISPVPIEPRGTIAQFEEGSQSLTVWLPSQGPYESRTVISRVLGLPQSSVRIICPEIGGAFGSKLSTYPEEILVSVAAMKMGKPVRWIENRTECFQSMTHGRGQNQFIDVAYDGTGKIQGLKVRLVGDAGAYLTEESSDATFTLKMAPGAYAIPAYSGTADIVITNKVPHDAYRGASRPEATYLIERAIDEIAHELNLDPVEVRLRNFVPKDLFPYQSISGLKYDSGDYVNNLLQAIKLSDYRGWRERQKLFRKTGRLVGIGLITYVERCGTGPDVPQTASMHVDQSGWVTIVSGTSPQGQGHDTTLSQIAGDILGVSIDKIKVRFGDTSLLPWGTFTAGSRSGSLGGGAVHLCAQKLREKMGKIAEDLLHVPEDEITFADNWIFSKKTPEKRIAFEDVASVAYKPRRLPPEMEPALYTFSCFVPETNTFPFGTHVAVVEVDKETGKISILQYVAVDDVGRVLNPLVVEGQVHGGIVQGLGQALFEEVKYDEEGQLLTSSLIDYQIPLATDVPEMQCYRTETPTQSNPMGVKGVGEAGTIAATPVIANAVVDALYISGLKLRDLPLRPEYIFSLFSAK